MDSNETVTNKKSNVKKNYIYNLIYQMVALLTPLVVTPFVSRVLGSAGLGQYTFTYSIATYFVLLSSLGFSFYSQREIARHQGDKKQQSIIFYEIMIAKTITTLVSVVIYIIPILAGLYGEVYTTLMWILLINIVSTFFDVSFLFQGNENFGIIALRNIIIKIIGVVLIIVFVKNESDVWIYTLCQSIILIVSNVSLWPSLPKYLTRVKAKELHVARHFIPSIRLFIPTVAISVYTVFDKTLIGIMIPGATTINGVEKSMADVENGFYDNAEKLVKTAMTIITSLGIVMNPRNSQAIAVNNYEEFNNNIKKAIQFVFFLGFPITFGICSVSLNFAPWYFGSGFEKVPYLMMTLSPLVLLIGLSNVLGIQYLIPLGRDRKYTISIVIGAAINLCLNLVLIYFLWSFGACIATIIAEFTVTLIMAIFARKDVGFREYLRLSWKYLASGLVMFGAVFATQHFLSPSPLHTFLLIGEGMVCYLVLLLIFQDSFLKNTLSRLLFFRRNKH